MKKDQVEGLIERYLYEVVRRLQEKQRKDIEQELRTLIEDMVSEKEEEGMNCEMAIKKTLEELGDPQKLAKNYRGEENSLISGIYYDLYCYILKMSLIWVSVGVFVSNIVSAIVHVVDASERHRIFDDFGNIAKIPNILLVIVGGTTLVFAFMQRYQVNVSKEAHEWSLKELPEIPVKKAVIGRGESAFGIIVELLFLVIFIFAPQLLGAWFWQDDTFFSVPLFNLTIWTQVLPLFVCTLCFGMFDDFVKLIVGKYTYKSMIVTIVTDCIGYGICLVIFTKFPIWNPAFMSRMQEITGRISQSKGDIFTYFNTDTFTIVILGFLLFVYLLDMGTTIYHTVRYGEKQAGKIL